MSRGSRALWNYSALFCYLRLEIEESTMKKLLALLALCGAVGFATPVWAEQVASAEGVVAEAVVAEAAEAAPAPSLSKADNAWIIVASAFVILMRSEERRVGKE